jgi:hypothetical protein
MAVFSYNGGRTSISTGGYGNIFVRKSNLQSFGITPSTTIRSFTEGTPTTGLFDPVDRVYALSRVTHSSGYAAKKISLNTTQPYNSSSYYSPYNTVFEDIQNYNTDTSVGDYWANAFGFVNTETGTGIASDNEGGAWVTGAIDYCNATTSSITASLTPVGSFTNSTTTMTSGTNDSGYWFLASPPFNHNIFALNNPYVVVHTNSWISFQPLVNATNTTFSATSPNYANIQIGAGQASCQRIYWGTFGTAPNRTYRIRFEGTNATTGTLGSPNMVWEFILYESNPNIFDIQIGAWTPPTTNTSGLSDGSTYLGGTYVPAANTGRRFSTSNVVAGQSANNISLVKYNRKGHGHVNKNFFPNGTDDQIVVSIGRDGPDQGDDIKVGSDGKIYILYTSFSNGYVSGTTNGDLGVIKINPDHLYFTQYNTSESIEWARTFGTTSSETGRSFDLDSEDNLYVTGWSNGSGQGGNDVIILKINKYGEVVWKKTYGASLNDNASGISVSGQYVYVWGSSSSTPLTSGNTSDHFILKINTSNGSLVAQKHFNNGSVNSATTFPHSLETDEFGNVYVAGFANSTSGYFVNKFDSSLNFVWSRTIGVVSSGGSDTPTGIRYKNGILYIASQDSTYFLGGESYNTGIAAINPSTGQVTSAYTLGGVSTDYGLAVDVDDENNIYVSGSISSTLTGLESATNLNTFAAKLILDQPDTFISIGGSAATHQCLNVSYSGSGAIYSAKDIVFQDDLIGVGNQYISVTTQPSQVVTYRLTRASYQGSGSVLRLKGGYYVTATQYLRETETLSNAAYYNKSSSLTLTSVTVDENPATGEPNFPSNIVWRFTQNTNTAGIPTFDAGRLVPLSNTGILPENTTIVVSFFAKTDNWNKIILLAYGTVFNNTTGAGNGNTSIEFNLDTGISVSLNTLNNPLYYGMIPYKNGWYRCYVAVRMTTSSNQSTIPAWFQIRMSQDSVLGSTVFVYGPQVQTSRLTKYIPNIGTQALTSTVLTEDYVDTEVSFDPPESTVLFGFSNSAGISYFNPYNKPVQTYVGSSELAYLSAYEIAFDAEYYTYGTQLQFSSPPESPTKFEKEFTFSASPTGKFTLSGAATALKKVLNPPENIQLFVVSGGYTNLQATKDWVGQTGTTPKVTGSAVTRAPNRHIGSSPTEYYTASAIAFGDENNIRTDTSGDGKYTFVKAPYTGSGNINNTSNGTAGKKTAKVAFIQVNTIILYNTNVITKLAMLYAGKSPTTPFGGLDIVFEELEPNAPPKQFSYSGAAEIPTLGFRWNGIGSIVTTGAYTNLRATKDYVGSGSIATNITTTSSVTFNPVEDTTLFVISDGYSDLKATKDWVGTGNIKVNPENSKSPKSLTKTHSGSSLIQYYTPYEVVFGEGEIFNETQYKFTGTALSEYIKPPFAGGGSLFVASGAAKAVGSNPPENTFLYEITGAYSDLKATKDWVGTGTLLTNINGSASITYEGGATTQLFSVSGTVTEKYGKGLYTGDGYLFTTSGAAEATGSNPPEDTFLFTITGAYSDLKATKDYIGQRGTNYSITGAAIAPPKVSSWVGNSPIEYYKPYQIVFEEGVDYYPTEFKLASTSIYTFQKATFVSSGSLFVASGAAKSVIYNPPDQTLLATITGAVTQSQTFRETFSGSLFTSGFYSDLQVTFNPSEDTYLLNISGSAIESQTEVHYGSGSLFTASGSAEATGVNPPENTFLFTITGAYSDLKATKDWVGTGSTSISGQSSSTSVSAWVGTSPVEYYSPYEVVFGEGELYDINSYDLNNAAIYEYIEAPYFGSGSLFTTSGAAEATGSNPPEDTFLFTVTNGYSDLKATKDWVGTGAISISDSADVAKAFGNFEGSSPLEYYDPYEIVFENEENFYSTEYQFSNYATFSYTPTTYIVSPTGKFTLSGAATALKKVLNPPEDTFLFEITGQHGTRVFVPNWISTGGILTNINGTASVTFNPPEDTYLFSVSGTAVEKNTEAWIGTGNLFTASGSSQTVGANPPEGTYLFVVSGTAGVKLRDYVWISPIVEFDPYELVLNDDFVVTDYIDIRNSIWDSNANITRSAITETFTSRNVATGGSLFTSGFYSNLKVSFTPAKDTTLFVVSGTVTEKQTEVTSGTGSLFTASGAAEATGVNPPDQTVIATISGAVTQSQTDVASGNGTIGITGALVESTTSVEIGSGNATFGDGTILALRWSYNVDGSISVDSSATASVTWNPVEDTTLFVVSGAVTQSKTFGNYDGSGSLFSSGFYSNLQVTFNPPEDTYLYEITGAYSDLKATYVEVGSGSLFTDVSGVASVTFNPPENTFLYEIAGTLEESITVVYEGITTDITLIGEVEVSIESGGYRGSGSLFIASGAAEAFGANPPENTFLYEITGAYSDLKATYAEIGSGSATISGAYSDLKFTSAWNGSGTFTVTGTADESYTRSNYDGSGSLFTASGSAEAFVANPPENTFLYEITGAYSDLKATSVEIGTGSLFTDVSGVASVTFNPPEDTVLFAITGAYSDLKATSVEIGTGSLFTASGAAEATGSNPPENTFLFEVSGALVESTTNIISGSGSATISGAYSDLKFTSAWNGSGTIIISGSAIESQTDITSGSGSLFTTSGAAEAFGANPPENTFLYTFTGSVVESQTEVHYGSGSLFTTSGAAEATGVNPPENTFLYEITGAYSDLKATSVEIGSGSIASLSGAAERVTWNPVEDTQLFVVSGALVESTTNITSGSGSLFTTSGAAEATGVNPPENTFLYEITGAYSDLKATYVEVGSGSLFTDVSGVVVVLFSEEGTGLFSASGVVIESTTNITSGSGSLFTDVSGVASVTFNPPENTFLYEITGAYSDLKATSVEIGSGSLFTTSGAAEAFGANPPENTFLFEVSGVLVESTTNITSSSGSLFTNGFYSNLQVTFNPSEDTVLFTIDNGYSELKATYVEVGSGSFFTDVSGVASITFNEIGTGLFSASGIVVESSSNTTSGSGSLFTDVSGIASVTFNPLEDTVLFTIDNGYSDLKATYAEIGTGSLFGFDSATVASAVTVIGTGLFEISDTAQESTTYKTLDGSGSLFAFEGGVESVTFNPVEDTILFEVAGDSNVTTTFGYGGGSLQLSGSGEAIFARALVPQTGEGSFFSSGESTSAKVFAPFIGSGSLFAVGGSSSTTTNVPVVGVFVWASEPRNILYVYGGSADVDFVFDYEDIGLLNISGTVIVRTLLPERIYATII